MTNVLVIAPHPDDETLGVGGTILKHKFQNDRVAWLIMTAMHEKQGFQKSQIEKRNEEIELVNKAYQFDEIFQLNLPTTQLDTLPMGDIVSAISNIFDKFKPTTIYIPYHDDVHSDHKIVYQASVSCSKWFRHPYLRKILCYEVLSETDCNLNCNNSGFTPNTFVDISAYVDQKIQIMNTYSSEIFDFPFPRSEETIKALASIRGSCCGADAAEAFVLLKEIV